MVLLKLIVNGNLWLLKKVLDKICFEQNVSFNLPGVGTEETQFIQVPLFTKVNKKGILGQVQLAATTYSNLLL